MGVKLLGSVASILIFSRLVEMLYSCRCMQFCALPGTQESSELTGRVALLSLSGKGRVIARTATTTELGTDFSPKRSTIDRILALWVLTEHR